MSQRIECSTCGCLIAELEDGVLVIEGKHHGQKHRTRIPLAELVAEAGDSVLAAGSYTLVRKDGQVRIQVRAI